MAGTSQDKPRHDEIICKCLAGAWGSAHTVRNTGTAPKPALKASRKPIKLPKLAGRHPACPFFQQRTDDLNPGSV